MKKASIKFKTLREQVLLLEMMPRCKGFDWELDGKVYFIPESVSRAVVQSATMEQLLRLAGEDGFNDDDGSTAEWCYGEILKRVKEKSWE